MKIARLIFGLLAFCFGVLAWASGFELTAIVFAIGIVAILTAQPR